MAGAGGPIGWTSTYNENGPVLTLGRVGACGALNSYDGPAWVTDNALVVRPHLEELRGLLSLYFSTVHWQDLNTGTSQPLITQTLVRGLDMALPPLAEQRRIVAKVEALLAQVNAARERLAKVPLTLKRFRRAVLAAACFGKLTEHWRTKQPFREIDLIQIADARRAAYLQSARRARAAGLRKPRQLLPDAPPDVNLEVEVPSGWAVTNVGYVAHVTKLAGFEYTKYLRPSERGDVPLVRAQNVQMGYFVGANLLFIDRDTSASLERSQLHGREVLMVFIGAGTGNVCLAPEGRWHLAPNVAKLDPDVSIMDRRFLALFLESPVGREGTGGFVKATAQESLSMGTIREIPSSCRRAKNKKRSSAESSPCLQSLMPSSAP